ncbi:MAG: D-tyrosyl-tRNA(Tyr) deacylase [Acidobacteria bacterium]|nr:MAG: D-tyrosyl-tRNA(Tyr) deacylase [Acidobacteriota bacterium]
MRVLLQRVSRARVRVGGEITGEIGAGYVALIGVARGDTQADMDYLCRKIAALRLWPDEAGKMNRSLLEAVAAPAVLAISQFTLLADTRRGLRPSFDAAAPPEEARPLYEGLIAQLRTAGVNVATGVFQADMDVELVNQGPVTVLLDSRDGVAEKTQITGRV